MNLGFSETAFLVVLGLLLFGPKKLPELGKGIGEGFRALKEGMKDKPADTTSSNASATGAGKTDVKS